MNKKKIIIIASVLLLIILIWIIFGGAIRNKLFTNKLETLGYSGKEIKLIEEKVFSDDYDLVTTSKNDEVIDVISAKGYRGENLKKYLDYYSKYKNCDMEDIITIVNSGYDLSKYEPTSTLADLVTEKYYIYDNTSKYLKYYSNNENISLDKVVGLVNSKADNKFYTNTKNADLNKGNLILVNKYYYLKDNYIPDDLVTLTNKYNGGTNNMMRKDAANAFMEMVDAALLDNIILKNMSAYRSYNYQVNLYDKYVQKDGKEAADIYSARPGYSEHQTGLCTDINDISSSFEGTDASNWLVDNAYKYGFILRFPKGKEDITGYTYEPWHYRYVGKNAAKIIHDNDLTLEEYYAYYLDK